EGRLRCRDRGDPDSGEHEGGDEHARVEALHEVERPARRDAGEFARHFIASARRRATGSAATSAPCLSTRSITTAAGYRGDDAGANPTTHALFTLPAASRSPVPVLPAASIAARAAIRRPVPEVTTSRAASARSGANSATDGARQGAGGASRSTRYGTSSRP